MKYVLGYDLGTSYFKAALVSESGDVLGHGRVRTPKNTAGPIVTITPESFWKAIKGCTEAALGQAGVSPQDVCGISYGSQANSFILLDKNHTPLTDIYVWSTSFTDIADPRAAALWGRPDYLDITGQGYTGNGFALAKLLWLKSSKPEMWSRVYRFMTISDYLIFGLTGTEVTDASSSSLLGCLDIRKNSFWNEGLSILGHDPALFSPVLRMGEFCGITTSGSGELAGLSQGIPVFAGGLDHVVAAIGAGLGTVAEVSESTGTVLACLAMQPVFLPQPAVSIGSSIREGEYTYLAFHDPGAQVIEDYHDRHFPGISIDEMLALSQNSPPGASGLQYLESAGEGELDEYFICESGLGKYADADYIRAITENIAYRIWKLSKAVNGGRDTRRIVATGGANRSIDLLQVKADMLFAEVVSCREKELGTFGAAMIAARGCRWAPDIARLQESWIVIEHTVQPDYRQHRLYKEWLAGRE